MTAAGLSISDSLSVSSSPLLESSSAESDSEFSGCLLSVGALMKGKVGYIIFYVSFFMKDMSEVVVYRFM